MAKRGKKKQRQAGGSTSRVSKQMQSSSPWKRVKDRRYAIWSISGLIVVMAVVSAWAILGNSSRSLSESTSINQSRAEVPAADSGNSSDSVSGGPQIDFPETSYDFGTIAQGSKVSHTFIVRNVGDAPLRLIRAKGS